MRSAPSSVLPLAAKLLMLGAGTAILLALGIWQISRGNQKIALLESYEASRLASPVALNSHRMAPKEGESFPVLLKGTPLPGRQLLLDGQFQSDRPGYDVWTPVQLDDGGLILLDRGWIALSERSSVADPPVHIQIRGLWRSLPRAGFHLGSGNCARSSVLQIVVYPNLADLRCLFGATFIDGIVLLDSQEPDGFVRVWTPASGGLPPIQHFGYAVTWFALAASLLFLGLTALFKRK